VQGYVVAGTSQRIEIDLVHIAVTALAGQDVRQQYPL